MKRFLSVFLSVLILLSFVACSTQPDSTDSHSAEYKITLSNEENSKIYTAVISEDSPVIIGRQDTCDIVINDNKYISRTHCKLSLSNKAIILSDMESTNGTFVITDGNWTQITEKTEINVGDQFMIGLTVLTLTDCQPLNAD